MTFQKLNVPNGQSALAGLVALDRHNPKIIRIVVSRFSYKKKFGLFYIN